MSHDALSHQQFHEMTSSEFEAHPSVWWHGTQTGDIGHQGGSFHVGSRDAAATALAARIHSQYVPREDVGRVVQGHPTAKLVAGHIVSPMTNTPRLSPRRREGMSKWEVAAGIPRGEMTDWSRYDKSEPMSDVRANAVEAGLRKSGRPMRRGMYYVNASEGAHEDVPISAIVPNRAGFKTHRDYVHEALAQGKNVPQHVRDEHSL